MTDMTPNKPPNPEVAANNRRIAAAHVAAAALAECITLIRAGRFGEFPRSADCGPAFAVAIKHGGDAIAAQALHTRLLMLEMLQHVDAGLIAPIAALSPESLGAILARTRLTLDGASLGIDGDALAQAILAAGPAVGRA